MLPLWKAGRSAAQDVLRDHIKEPEGSSFHLTLPISGVLQSMHFLISPRALCWHWETNLEAAGCGFFCCKESIKNRLHTQQNRYIFVCPLNSVWSRTHFYLMFFFPLSIEQTVLSEMIWQEMFSGFKKYWHLLIVELIKLLLSRSQSASAVIHPSICLIRRWTRAVLFIFSSEKYSATFGRPILSLCLSERHCSWPAYCVRTHHAADVDRSDCHTLVKMPSSHKGTARTRSQSVWTQAGEIWSDFVSSVKYNLLMEKEAPIK